MGGGRFTPSDWGKYTDKTTKHAKTVDDIYTSRGINKDLNPHGVKIRESRDSDDNPNSNAVIVGLDVTGSMGMVLDVMAREAMKTLILEIYDRKPVSDPHVMIMGIGDVECDSAPLQVTQFEADIRVAEQLTKIYLERGGGGNSYESYTFPWYFAAMHTSIDCFEKRGKKGYIFTVGDEEPTVILRKDDILRFLGSGPEVDLDPQALLTMVSRNYDVFHVMVAEGSHMRHYKDRVIKKWSDLLGQRALLLNDHTKLSEVIVSAIQVNEGAKEEDVIASWDGSTSVTVAEAIKGMSTSLTKSKAGEKVVML